MGCGVGAWLAVAIEHGIEDVTGVDGPYVDPDLLEVPADMFLPHDLAEPLELGREFDLAISLEVAEHLPPSVAEVFVDSLVRHAPAVLFSAAVPGQGGTNHLNEQWPSVWAAIFAQRQYVMVDCIRDRIWHNTGVPVCYRQNTFLYVRHDTVGSNPSVSREVSRYKAAPIAMVHPELFGEVLGRPLSTRRILRESPGAFRRTLSERWKKMCDRD